MEKTPEKTRSMRLAADRNLEIGGGPLIRVTGPNTGAATLIPFARSIVPGDAGGASCGRACHAGF
jgi:hypothetical protein